MKPDPHPLVREWLNEQVAETLYLSSVTLAELLFSIDAARDTAPYEVAGVTVINPWEI